MSAEIGQAVCLHTVPYYRSRPVLVIGARAEEGIYLKTP